VSDTVDYQLKHLLPAVEGRRRYYRFQREIEHSDATLDEISDEHLRALRLAANLIIDEEKDALEELCGQLTATG